MTHLIAEFIEALKEVESFDSITSLIVFFSSSTVIFDLNSGTVSNSNKIDLYTISASFLLSKSIQTVLFI